MSTLGAAPAQEGEPSGHRLLAGHTLETAQNRIAIGGIIFDETRRSAGLLRGNQGRAR
jgi:hypothetical protein